MGKPKRRVNPKVVSRVNRDLEYLFLVELVRVVSGLEPPWPVKGRGRPPHDPRVVVVACVLKVAFCHTYDSIESALKNPRLQRVVQEAFGVEKMPGHTVIHNGMVRCPMKYIRRLIKRVCRRFRGEDLVVVVDATGFRVISSSTWYDIRIKRKNRRRDHDKLHIVVEVRRGVIVDFQVTGAYRHDSRKLAGLLRELQDLLRVVGDAGYLSKNNCKLVAAKGAQPLFALKKNTVLRDDASPQAWKDMVAFAQQHPDKWALLYHVRSLVEAVFSAIKRRFRASLSSVKKRLRHKEMALKVLAYDVIRSLYDQTAETLGEPFWITCKTQ